MAKSIALQILVLLLVCGCANAADLDSARQFCDAFLYNMWGSDATFPDTVKYRWLNAAFGDIEKMGIIQRETTITMVSDQRKYDLPSDFVQGGAWAAYYHQTQESGFGIWRGLPFVFPGLYNEELEKEDRQISVWGSSISVVPPPKGTDYLYVMYSAKILRFYGDDDTTNIPEEGSYRDFAIYYACWLASKATEEDNAAEFLGKAKEIKDEIRFDAERIRVTTQPKSGTAGP